MTTSFSSNPVAARLLGVAALCLASGVAFAAGAPATPTAAVPAEERERFERKIRPLLVDQCFACHSGTAKSPFGGLRLDSRAALLKGGGRGAAVVPGDPDNSLLMKVVRHQMKGLEMPPKAALPREAIEELAAWIRAGAPFEEKVASPSKAAAARHWAFQPLRPVGVPAVRRTGWVRSPLDAFILSRLEGKGLRPGVAADRPTWLRRVTFDLTGLPPTPAELDQFLADPGDGAYERVVDRLLASPHYGERWARHWLDLVRYAETDGHEFDFEKPGAYQYRDYVIRALNQDVPYDQLVREHLAGDLLSNPRRHPTEGFNESVLGTGFLWFGEGKHSPVDLREDEAERTDNEIDVLAKSFLGLTAGCARCHDHKFDPITGKDYYALFGYLKSTRQELVDMTRPAARQAAMAGLEPLVPRLQAQLSAAGAAAAENALEQFERAMASPAASGTWGKRLKEAENKPSDPLYALARLAADAAETRSTVGERLVGGKRVPLIPFEEFDGSDFSGWRAGGEAFGAAPTHTEQVRFQADSSDRPAGSTHRPAGSTHRPEGVLARGVAYSGALSDRLCGVLRSRTFTLEHGRVLYYMAGRDTQVNLIIDGFQRIRNPIYGGLTIPVNTGARMEWFVQDVTKWVGHRAYIELVDRSTTGYLAVDRIVFFDAPAPPTPNPLVAAAVAGLPDTRRDTQGTGQTTTPETGREAAWRSLVSDYVGLLRQTLSLWRDGGLATDPQRSARVELLNLLLRDAGAVEAEAEAPGRAGTLSALLAERSKLEAGIPEPVWAPAAADGTGEDEPVHLRGNPKILGEVAPRRLIVALGGMDQPAAGEETSGRRTLTERIVAHPLLARVMVNRVWRHHFGEGIVRTPDDFGTRGEPPTHPALLEWLTRRFITEGWSLKRLHRGIVLSATYRMTSQARPEAEAADPQNRLLHRMPVRRLEAEAIRDAILAVSGRLDPTLQGPSVAPHLTPFMVGRGRPAASGPLDGSGRRSVYLGVRRNFLNPMFLAFDYPIPFTTMGRRAVSTVPAQALIMMNNPFVVEQARVWAKNLLAPASSGQTATSEARIRSAYRTAFTREPEPEELQAALVFLQERGGEESGWADFCHVLLNTKEFIFIP